MRGLFFTAVIVIIIFAGIYNLDSRIYRDSIGYSPAGKPSSYLYLSKIENDGLWGYSYTLDGIDGPMKTSANTLGKFSRIGYFKDSKLALIGNFRVVGSEEMAGLQLNDTEICIEFLSNPINCFPRRGQNPIPVTVDFDKDGLDEISIYYFDSGKWLFYEIENNGVIHFLKEYDFSPHGYPVYLKGLNEDRIGVWQESETPYFEPLILTSEGTKEERFQFGLSGDIPLAFDFNCDGEEDLTVYRRSNATWYFRDRNGNVSTKIWGTKNAFPFVGYFDEDRCMDLAIFDRSVEYPFSILSSKFSEESLFVFPNGNSIFSKVRWAGRDKTPPQMVKYMLYKKAKMY